MTRIKVTTENIEEVREMVLASDMSAEVKVGSEVETWAIAYKGGQRGQMTVFHDTQRAALFNGGESVWGDWDDVTRTLRDEDGTEYDENGEPVEDDENDEGEPDTEALTDAINAGAGFVDNIAGEDDGLDESVTYPEFLQILVNANAPAWPTFATKLEDEAATDAAWERWQEIVEGQREERRQEAIHEEAKRLDHEEFLRLCEEAKKERNA